MTPPCSRIISQVHSLDYSLDGPTEELAEFIRALHNPESTLTTKCSECLGTSASQSKIQQYPSVRAFLAQPQSKTSCFCSFLLADCQGMQKRKSSSFAKTCFFIVCYIGSVKGVMKYTSLCCPDVQKDFKGI